MNERFCLYMRKCMFRVLDFTPKQINNPTDLRSAGLFTGYDVDLSLSQ